MASEEASISKASNTAEISLTGESLVVTGRIWTEIGSLDEESKDTAVLIRGRVQTTVSVRSNTAFFVLGENGPTVQCVVTGPPDLVKLASSLNRELLVQVYGIVSVPVRPIRSTTQRVQIKAKTIDCITEVMPNLRVTGDTGTSQKDYISAVRNFITKYLPYGVLLSDLKEVDEWVHLKSTFITNLSEEFEDRLLKVLHYFGNLILRRFGNGYLEQLVSLFPESLEAREFACCMAVQQLFVCDQTGDEAAIFQCVEQTREFLSHINKLCKPSRESLLIFLTTPIQKNSKSYASILEDTLVMFEGRIKRYKEEQEKLLLECEESARLAKMAIEESTRLAKMEEAAKEEQMKLSADQIHQNVEEAYRKRREEEETIFLAKQLAKNRRHRANRAARTRAEEEARQRKEEEEKNLKLQQALTEKEGRERRKRFWDEIHSLSNGTKILTQSELDCIWSQSGDYFAPHVRTGFYQKLLSYVGKPTQGIASALKELHHELAQIKEGAKSS